MFELRYDDKKLKQLERTLRGIPRAMPKVMSRGLNRTATEARTKVGRFLSKRTGLKVKDVRNQIILRRASYRNWRSAIRISRKRIPLMAFRARQTQKGVTYKWGNKRLLVRHAFIATMVSGHKGVFRRKFTQRLPIDEQKALSLAQVFSGAESESARIHRESMQRLEKNIHDQVRLILRRRAG